MEHTRLLSILLQISNTGMTVEELMQKNQEEEMRWQVAVDTDFVEGFVGTRHTVVAQFRSASAGDMEEYAVFLDEKQDGFYSGLR